MTESSSRTLADLIADGPLPYGQFLDYATQIARSLADLHSRQLAHGSLNSHTMQVTEQGRLEIPAPASQVIASPESMREDLFETGLIYAQMLAMNREPETDQPIHPILSDDLPLDRATHLVPVEARLLLEDLLAEDPAQRMKSATELVSTLEELKALQLLPLDPSIEEGRDHSRLYFMIAAAALLLLIIWVLLGVVGILPRR